MSSDDTWHCDACGHDTEFVMRFCGSCRAPRCPATPEILEKWPLDEYPCVRCHRGDIPYLVDNGSEFYWEHSGRGNCLRLNDQWGRAWEGAGVSRFDR